MARQVLPIVGAVVGAFFGVPQLGFAIGSIVGNLVDPVINQGPKMGELPVQTSNEGMPRAIIYGTSTCSGYILAFGPALKTTEIQTGEKGAPKTEVEVVYRNYAIAICEGPIAGVLRVWRNDKLVYDIRAGSLMLEQSAQWLQSGTQGKVLYLGDEDQLPDVFLELNVSGIGTTPAYRGTAYMVFGLDDVTDTQGAIPQYRWEVAREWDYTPAADPDDGLPADEIDTFFDEAVITAPIQLLFGAGALMPSGTESVFCAMTESRHPSTPTGDMPELSYQIQVNGVPSPVDTANRIGPGMIWVDCVAGDLVAVIVEQITTGSETALKIATLNGAMYPATTAELGFGDSGYATGLPTTVGAVVADMCDRVGLVADDDYDTAEIDEIPLTGMTITGDYTASDTINTLRSCYFFDKAEPGDKIYFPLRGKPVVETLTFDDLVDVPDLSRREQLSEIPKKLHLLSLDPIAGYSPVQATYERSSVDVKAVAEITTSVPVVLDVDERQQMAHKIFKVMSTDAQGEVKLSIPDKFIRIIPSDCVGLALRDQVLRLRYDDGELQEGVMGMTLRRDRQSAYTSDLTGIPIPEPMLPPSTLVGTTEFVIMDMSVRQDSEDDLNILVAGSGGSDGWYGWALQRSIDGGANWTTVATYTSAATIGTLLEDVPDASEDVTDTTNVVRIALDRPSQQLESITETQFLSEGGAFWLEKADGSGEVMQYLDAVEDSSGLFELSTLHRGRLNSGTAAHTAGAKFVMLETAEHLVMESAHIGQSIMWRGVSLSASPESAVTVTETYLGRSQIEWPVASLSLARDGSDNITGTWAPRHRLGTDDAPVASVNFTGYRVTLDDGVLAAVTFDTTVPTFTYDASALGDPLTVSVQALNRITGAGPAETGTV